MSAPELLGGRYEVRGVLGRGGMAEVRDGWDTRLARPVAIKILYPGYTAQPDNRRRFEAEAQAAAGLNNTHIVAVHDSGEHDGTPFIVMERLAGESLHDKIAQGPLPQAMVRSVLDDVLAALASAHEAGILHRDIKPANILFTSSGEAKVSDFGIAKSGPGNFTATGQVFGTMGYLSPDRVLGKAATAADDLYAVGVVGYEALTGRRAFPQDNLAAVAQAILHDQLPSIVVLRPDVDPGLAAIVERAMARDPALRFQSAHEMRAALAGYPVPVVSPSGTRVLTAPVPPMPIAPVPAWQRPSKRNKMVLLAAIAAALLLALVLIVFDSPQTTAPPVPVTTSTPVVPPPTTMPAPPPTTAADMPSPATQPPGHKPGKPGKPGKPHGGEGD